MFFAGVLGFGLGNYNGEDACGFVASLADVWDSGNLAVVTSARPCVSMAPTLVGAALPTAKAAAELELAD